MMKKMDKGFTLIELMIVVAIIGILAAVAIPGFIRYIKDSKTSEAKENLKSIGDGALAFYQTEHPTSATGATITKQFPSANVCVTVNENGVMTCGTLKPNVPETTPEVGVKTVETAAWQNEPWKSLKFSISKAFYYQYNYVGSGATTGGFSSFEVVARAKLDKTTVDSCFKMDGQKDTTTGEASIGAMIDLSEGGNCPTSAVAPAAAATTGGGGN